MEKQKGKIDLIKANQGIKKDNILFKICEKNYI